MGPCRVRAGALFAHCREATPKAPFTTIVIHSSRMALRDTLGKLTCHFHRKLDASCLTEEDVVAAGLAAGAAFPERCKWHPVDYPGKFTLPIYLVPLASPIQPRVETAVAELHTGILKDGTHASLLQINSRYEKRQAHLWLALLAKGQYLPIGQATFILEENRRVKDVPASDSAEPNALRLIQRESQSAACRWWLSHVWLKPPYRCQRIFRDSVPYFSEWHPDFLVRDPCPPLARALKEHPRHMFDAGVEWF